MTLRTVFQVVQHFFARLLNLNTGPEGDGNRSNNVCLNGKVVIHCIRHAKAGCNDTSRSVSERRSRRDSPLNKIGAREALTIRQSPLCKNTISAIVSSPLRRTLQTALVGFETVLEQQGLRVIAWPDLKEWGRLPCNMGSNLEYLKVWLRSEKVELGLLREGWEKDVCTQEEGWGRPERVRRSLWKLGRECLKTGGGTWKGLPVTGRKDKDGLLHIVVVSHGGFLRTLIDDGLDHPFWNTEHRSFEFVSAKQIARGVEPWTLYETEESKLRNLSPLIETVVGERAEKAKTADNAYDTTMEVDWS